VNLGTLINRRLNDLSSYTLPSGIGFGCIKAARLYKQIDSAGFATLHNNLRLVVSIQELYIVSKKFAMLQVMTFYLRAGCALKSIAYTLRFTGSIHFP